MADHAVQNCPTCKVAMASTELPGYGTVWHCEHCQIGLHTESGGLHRWHRPITKIERRDRHEKKVMSERLCPECRQPMWEVDMPDFGPRWQCEHCRLTVFSSGGIQRWGASG